MLSHSLSSDFLALPKAELHLHLEGSIEPSTVTELAARHGETVTEQEARARYSYTDFAGFIEAFKWVTAYLRGPDDFALITRRLAERLLAQNVVYAELTLSVGVMLWRKQSAEANFEAMLRVAEEFSRQGLRLRWIFDVTRQFGAEPAMRVAEVTAKYVRESVVAFGMGGDELSVPAAEFRAAYDYAAERGLHRLVHAGEIGGPGEIRDAIELLGAERIGHGIAAMHDPELQELLAERRIPLEICPTSNICTGALAKQLGQTSAQVTEHPLPTLLRRGLPIVISSDDPAMFHTSLLGEYAAASSMGLTEEEQLRLLAMSFEHAFDGPPPIED
jgi:aminodeoxyfutalosine deaminase